VNVQPPRRFEGQTPAVYLAVWASGRNRVMGIGTLRRWPTWTHGKGPGQLQLSKCTRSIRTAWTGGRDASDRLRTRWEQRLAEGGEAKDDPRGLLGLLAGSWKRGRAWFKIRRNSGGPPRSFVRQGPRGRASWRAASIPLLSPQPGETSPNHHDTEDPLGRGRWGARSGLLPQPTVSKKASDSACFQGTFRVDRYASHSRG